MSSYGFLSVLSLVIKDQGSDTTTSTSIFCERAKSVASLWMGVELNFLCISSCVALQIDSRFVWEKECSFGFVTSLLL